MLMGPSTVKESYHLKRGINTFLEATGLEINKEKSQVYFFNTPKITRWNILKILEFSEDVLLSKYLSAHLADSTIKQISRKYFLDKIKKHFGQWTVRALNILIKLILIKSILQAMSL